MKYVLLKTYDSNEIITSLIDDPVEAYKTGKYKEENGDKIFQLGSEIKIKFIVEQVEVHRENRIAQENIGLKGDLGVGDYRG